MNAQIPPLENFEVPSGYGQTDCNEASRFPFGYPHPATVRYQQVYSASAFASLPAGGSFLSWVIFRGDCSPSYEPTVTNVQINASTTSKGIDLLSAVFAENVGSDEIVVYRGTSFVRTPGNPGDSLCPNAAPSGLPIIVDTPYFYNPARGNLLLDIRVSGVSLYPDDELPPRWWSPSEEETWPHNKLDAQSDPAGVLSRAAALSQTATTAEVVDTTGLWTRFLFAPTPSIEVTNQTNEIVLSWSRALNGFRLQSNDNAEMAGPWQDYFGETSILGWYKYVRIAKPSLAARRYYRLLLETTQPLPEPPASPVVEVNASKTP